MMMKIEFVFLVFIAASIVLNSCAMEMARSKNQETYFVPAIAQKNLTNVAQKALLSIQAEEELSYTGTITGLAIRPKEHERKIVSTLKLTRLCVEGDKNNSELDAVTLMRSDVAEALGGLHLVGDNMSVSGMGVGEKFLNAGDLLVIKGNQQQIKAILLKTHIPHYACWRFVARFGKLAFNFINAEGQFEAGIWKKHPLIPFYYSRLVHGLKHRLRGLRLFVLKEGEVEIGDTITIVSGALANDLLNTFNLKNDYNDWLEKSIEIGVLVEKEEKAKRAIRSSAAGK